MAKKKPENYVDNKTFYKQLVDYRDSCLAADERGEVRPRITEKIGLAIYQIANRLALKPNFFGYPFKEEMISDGIENACDAVLKFNPDKSENPFAYFTQIIYYAFLRRIQKEKKHLYTKYKATEHMNVFNEVSDRQSHDSGEDFNDGIKYGEWTQEYMSEFVENFEANKRRKKKKRTTVNEVV